MDKSKVLPLLDVVEDCREKLERHPKEYPADAVFQKICAEIKEWQWLEKLDVPSLLSYVEERREKVEADPWKNPPEHAVRLISAEIAGHAGFQDRMEWTALLKSDSSTKYHGWYGKGA